MDRYALIDPRIESHGHMTCWLVIPGLTTTAHGVPQPGAASCSMPWRAFPCGRAAARPGGAVDDMSRPPRVHGMSWAYCSTKA